MMKLFRKPLRAIYIAVMRLIAPLFFDRRYLRGRHFDNTSLGWTWAFRSIWWQKIIGLNRAVPWPVAPFNRVSQPQNIQFHPDDLNNFQMFGCYFQATSDGKIVIGNGCYIAPNVGLITANHDPCDPDRHLPSADIHLGERCWIGMNSMILPGVTLGPHTVVAAGAVVTRSFPDGYCVLGGVPAQVIKVLSCEDE